jgi:hypothetical protein
LARDLERLRVSGAASKGCLQAVFIGRGLA